MEEVEGYISTPRWGYTVSLTVSGIWRVVWQTAQWTESAWDTSEGDRFAICQSCFYRRRGKRVLCLPRFSSVLKSERKDKLSTLRARLVGTVCDWFSSKVRSSLAPPTSLQGSLNEPQTTLLWFFGCFQIKGKCYLQAEQPSAQCWDSLNFSWALTTN